MPMSGFLNVSYTSDPEEVNAWTRLHCADPEPDTYTVLGLDIEWKPVPRDATPNMALLQLATPWGHVMLFHLSHAPTAVIPEDLRRVFLDPRVLKLGIGILDDVMKINQKWDIRVVSYIDLVTLWSAQCAATGLNHRPEKTSLLSFAQYFTGTPSWKRKFITLSNWERLPLSHEQKLYAAMDAFMGAAIFVSMRPLKSVVDSLIVEVFGPPGISGIPAPLGPSSPSPIVL
jgi:hypothetical protein